MNVKKQALGRGLSALLAIPENEDINFNDDHDIRGPDPVITETLIDDTNYLNNDNNLMRLLNFRNKLGFGHD